MSILGEGDINVMAIYHFRVQIIKRNEGRSAVAAAAYRSLIRFSQFMKGRTMILQIKDLWSIQK